MSRLRCFSRFSSKGGGAANGIRLEYLWNTSGIPVEYPAPATTRRLTHRPPSAKPRPEKTKASDMSKDKAPRRPRAETPKGFRDYFGAEVTERKAMLDTIAEVYHCLLYTSRCV